MKHAATLVVLCLVICSCGIDSRLALGSQCSLSSECDSPLICRLERCRKECVSARDCAAGLRCYPAEDGVGVCQLEDEAMCTLDEDCPSTLICNSNNMQCTIQCTPDDEEATSGVSRDCAPGELCEEGLCVAPTAATGCILTSDCDAPLVCQRNLCVVECTTNIDCDEPGQVCFGVPGCSELPGVEGPCACRSPCDTNACPNLGTACIDCPDATSCAALDDGTAVSRYCERIASEP